MENIDLYVFTEQFYHITPTKPPIDGAYRFIPSIATSEDHQFKQLLASAFGKPEDEPLRFIDLGSGVGNVVCLIAKARPTWECIGYELDDVCLEASKKLATELRLDNVEFEKVNIIDDNVSFIGFDRIFTYRPLQDSVLYDKLKLKIVNALTPSSMWFEVIGRRLIRFEYID